MNDQDDELVSIDAELTDIGRQLALLTQRKHVLLSRKEEVVARRHRHTAAVKAAATAAMSHIDWATASQPWDARVDEVLRQPFGLRQFRPQQRAIVNATLARRDVFVVMPTGGGKSLCYQLPALVDGGLTLVVSPLVSLMADQLKGLNDLGIRCAMLTADVPKGDAKALREEIQRDDSPLRLLYVTPEKIAKSGALLSMLEKVHSKKNLARIVIDEAHCCSQWGHEFRPDYAELGVLRVQFADVPIIALTATASPKVQADVESILRMEGAEVFRSSFNRPNLIYEVKIKPEADEAVLTDICTTIKTRFNNMSGLVYCLSRKDTEVVADHLCTNGIQAACYHAQMEHTERHRVHSGWTNGRIKVVVATIAFGLGVNKPDVRFIVHHCLSKSIDSYYQESGRAGRDGHSAHCILYYRPSDMMRLSPMVYTQRTGLAHLYDLVRYCHATTVCRRTNLARHFGESTEALEPCNAHCDVCMAVPSKATSPLSGTPADRATQPVDVTAIAQLLLTKLHQNLVNNPLKRLTLVKVLTECRAGWKASRAAYPNLPDTAVSKPTMEQIVVELILAGVLSEEFGHTLYTTVSYVVPGSRAPLVAEGNQAVTIIPLVADDDTTSSTSGKRRARSAAEIGQSQSQDRRIKLRAEPVTIDLEGDDFQ